MYVAVKVSRVVSIVSAIVAIVLFVVVWSYTVGRHDGAARDRVEVCQSFGATDLAPCVAVLK